MSGTTKETSFALKMTWREVRRKTVKIVYFRNFVSNAIFLIILHFFVFSNVLVYVRQCLELRAFFFFLFRHDSNAASGCTGSY
jgi:hypothetical protein